MLDVVGRKIVAAFFLAASVLFLLPVLAVANSNPPVIHSIKTEIYRMDPNEGPILTNRTAAKTDDLVWIKLDVSELETGVIQNVTIRYRASNGTNVDMYMNSNDWLGSTGIPYSAKHYVSSGDSVGTYQVDSIFIVDNQRNYSIIRNSSVYGTASPGSGYINLDGGNFTVGESVPPITQHSIHPAPTGEWSTSDVEISLSASDNAPGPIRTQYRINYDGSRLNEAWVDYTGPIVISQEGYNYIDYRSIDALENVEQFHTAAVNIDKTAPVLKVTPRVSKLFPANHKLIPVQIDIAASDSLSEIDTIILVSITSNEPEAGLGRGDKEGDIQDAEFGAYDTSFYLRTERSSKDTPRIYTITYLAIDKAGNQTFHSATVTVAVGKS